MDGRRCNRSSIEVSKDVDSTITSWWEEGATEELVSNWRFREILLLIIRRLLTTLAPELPPVASGFGGNLGLHCTLTAASLQWCCGPAAVEEKTGHDESCCGEKKEDGKGDEAKDDRVFRGRHRG